MLTLRLPLQVNHLIDLLSGSGHEAYAVGCCVRDRLVDLIPAEWEVCTDASLAQAASCIQNELHIEPKQEPNSLMLVVDGVSLRVTTATFRQESSSSNPKPDLSDRGLTVNAIAYHPVKGLVNEFHGLEDLEGKLIRGIGDPDIYFRRNPIQHAPDAALFRLVLLSDGPVSGLVYPPAGPYAVRYPRREGFGGFLPHPHVQQCSGYHPQLL